MAYRILVVDDSKLARMAVGKLLNMLGPDWVRVEAANAEEALSQVKQSDFDAALLDFNMPERDGLHLAADLRALKPNLPLAVISANHQKEVVDRAVAAGATFLAKPLTEAALRGFLETVGKHAKERPGA
jgi:CheY-like chemotaxis protein